MEDMIESIKECHNRKESIIIINNLIMEIESNPVAFTTKLSLETDNIADEDLCGYCSSDLEAYTYSEDREYFGRPCREIITEMRCPECK